MDLNSKPMEEAQKITTPAAAPVASAAPAAPRTDRRPGGRGGAPGGRGGQPGRGGDNRGRGPRSGGRPEREPREFEQKILELARVTRVTKGGKRMRFRASVIIGDRRGRVGFGVAKGADVAMSVEKAFRQAKKNLITVPLVNETIPHEVYSKFAAAKVLLKPAPKGTGLKSGGPTRMVLELAGVPNAVSKLLGAKNKINSAKATFMALSALKMPKADAKK